MFNMQDEVDKISKDLTTDQKMDVFEKVLLDNYPVYEPKINHYFAPGIYIREMIAVKGKTLTSKIHKTEHFFEVTAGKIKTWDEFDGEIEIVAPYRGITKAGTRRAAEVLEDVTWSTIHAIDFITGNETNWSDEDKERLAGIIEEIVIEKHENPLIGNRYLEEITK